MNATTDDGRREMTKTQRAAHTARMAELRAIGNAHAARGTCPTCGSGLRRNLALTGWWQCGRFGVASFRAPEFRNLPACDFQTFAD